MTDGISVLEKLVLGRIDCGEFLMYGCMCYEALDEMLALAASVLNAFLLGYV